MLPKEPNPQFPDPEKPIQKSERPVLGFHESELPPEYALAAWEEIEKVMRLVPGEVKSRFFGQRRFETKQRSLEWYVAESMKRTTPSDHMFGPQLNVEKLFDLYEQSQSRLDALPPHREILMLNRDLCGNTVEWGLGLTDANLGLAVISPKRFIEGGYSPETALLMWRRLSRHEGAHLFGLVSRNFRVEEKLGRHCTNVCCMRQGMSMDEWERFALEEFRLGVEFCADCTAELNRDISQ